MDLPLLELTDLTMKGGYTWLNSWAPLSALAVTVSLLIHGGLLMVARAFSIKEFEGYAVSEILQGLAGAVIIGSLIVMLNSALELTHGFVAGDVYCSGKAIHIGTTNESTMDEAYDAIRCRLQEKAAAISGIQSNILTDSGLGSKFNILNLQASVFGITFLKGDWLNNIFRETETARITNNLATVLLIGLNTQSAVLAYLKANALTMFIPLGILLRSFFFTRGTGALFLAFGIDMYFIFPIFYVLLDPGFIPALPPPASASVPLSQQYCFQTMSSTVSVLQTLEAGGLGTTSVIGSESVKNELSKSYVQLMLHPLVAFFLTVVFIRYMMTVLGSDAYELVRMVGKVI